MAKAVYILGLTEGQGGFPDVWPANAVVRIVKDVKHDMLLEEECWLFYVALTRAREELYLITQLVNESVFISEIPSQFYSVSTGRMSDVVKPVLCEDCGTERKEYYNYCPTCGVRFELA